MNLLKKTQESSADKAKERLQIVVSHSKHDHCNSSLLDSLKNEIIEVISRVVSINEEQVDIQLVKNKKQSAIKVDILLDKEPV